MVRRYHFLLYILALECCNHRCGQVLSRLSSSQISRACNSQARHYAVISIWLLSAIISSSVFWDPLLFSSQVIGLVIMTVCLIVVVIFYWRIYIVLKRHKNQIQGLQIQEVQQGVQNGDLLNFLKLRKSALGTFYVCIVFMICYLPSYILSFLLLARLLSPISFYKASLNTTTLLFLNSSLNPVIYCWKMGPIRRTLVDIMRGIVNRFRE